MEVKIIIGSNYIYLGIFNFYPLVFLLFTDVLMCIINNIDFQPKREA